MMEHENEHVKASRDNTCWECDFDDVDAWTAKDKIVVSAGAVAFILLMSYIAYHWFS